MNKKLLIDTNIFLDAAMSERAGWEYATLLMQEVAYSGIEAYVAASSLKDIYYILAKYSSEGHARSFIIAMMDLCELVAIDEVLCRKAACSDEPDFEDGVIRACAESVPVDFIISRDANAFQRSPIKRLSAQEYLSLFCSAPELDL